MEEIIIEEPIELTVSLSVMQRLSILFHKRNKFILKHTKLKFNSGLNEKVKEE